MHHDPIVQEFVEASGQYVFAALYDEGEPLATFQHRQLRGNSYTGGGGVYRETIADPELEAVGRRLLDHLDWHGLACIEYMKDAETGAYKLAEINPRLWQSLPCAVRAGADFPSYYWLAATGRADEIDPTYEVGVRTHMLHGELGYLQSVRSDTSPFHQRPSLPREALAVASSCLTSPNFDTFRVDDPRPFLRGVGHVLRK
jgi:predicted ATP-grasp superfamily ATP-dependent carboligase